jgi:hypothetical protein
MSGLEFSIVIDVRRHGFLWATKKRQIERVPCNTSSAKSPMRLLGRDGGDLMKTKSEL